MIYIYILALYFTAVLRATSADRPNQMVKFKFDIWGGNGYFDKVPFQSIGQIWPLSLSSIPEEKKEGSQLAQLIKTQ